MTDLTSFRLLSFDVYGTLIDYETGILTALQPLLFANNRTSIPRSELLRVHHEHEKVQQSRTPDMPYSQLLETIHPKIAASLDLPRPTAEASKAYGESIGNWPAFPDTVSALRRLSKHYTLVVLSNVDRESFAQSNAGPLESFHFNKVITAQDVGSYKPDRRNFEYMLEKVEAEFGVAKAQVLQTAQSQFHDHSPAREMGIRSCWIVRRGAVMGNREEEIFDWKFDTLEEMADAVERGL